MVEKLSHFTQILIREMRNAGVYIGIRGREEVGECCLVLRSCVDV
jgi:hypothetical protein